MNILTLPIFNDSTVKAASTILRAATVAATKQPPRKIVTTPNPGAATKSIAKPAVAVVKPAVAVAKPAVTTKAPAGTALKAAVVQTAAAKAAAAKK